MESINSGKGVNLRNLPGTQPEAMGLHNKRTNNYRKHSCPMGPRKVTSRCWTTGLSLHNLSTKYCNVSLHGLWMPGLLRGQDGWGHTPPGRRPPAGGVGGGAGAVVPLPKGESQSGGGSVGSREVDEPQVRTI